MKRNYLSGAQKRAKAEEKRDNLAKLPKISNFFETISNNSALNTSSSPNEVNENQQNIDKIIVESDEQDKSGRLNNNTYPMLIKIISGRFKVR